MTENEMKNKISMELQNPITQQGFEIICKHLTELEQENNKLLDVINNQDVKIADLEKQIEKMKKCAICVDRHIWCVDCVNKSKFRLDVEIKDEN